jgi:hypothetical protein
MFSRLSILEASVMKIILGHPTLISHKEIEEKLGNKVPELGLLLSSMVASGLADHVGLPKQYGLTTSGARELEVWSNQAKALL